MANALKILGKGIVYLGLGALFIMAIIGTMSLDLLILCLISQSDRRNNNFFATLFMWDIMLSNRSSLYENIGFSLLASPFISAVTIGLSVAVGLPEFGLLQLAGWVGAFTILLAGAVIYGLGDTLEDAFSDMGRSRSHRVETTYTSSNKRMGKAFSRSAPSQQQKPFGKAAANEGHYGSPLNTRGNAPSPSAPARSDAPEEEPPSYYEATAAGPTKKK